MPPPQQPPWYHHITIDTLLLLLSRTLCNPFITALIIPLSLRACAKPYDSLSMLTSLTWSALVIIFRILAAVNKRVAYGPAREMDWENEVVVITGGSSGLGRCLAEVYGMRGASVGVLDLKVPDQKQIKEGGEAIAGVKWYQCDVSRLEDVQRAKEAIEKDLGRPTILINNAACPPPTNPLTSLTPHQYETTLNTNLHSHFHTLTTFLPSFLASPNGGHIVTVASLLGKLPPANLSAYTASKAGVIALHHSLTAELRSPTALPGSSNIRTILVTPGQLSTAMFAGVKLPWYALFLGPVVEPVELARKIVEMVDEGMGGEVSLPAYAGWIEWVSVLPVGLQRVVRWGAGIDEAMEGLGDASREGERKEGEAKGRENERKKGR